MLFLVTERNWSNFPLYFSRKVHYDFYYISQINFGNKFLYLISEKSNSGFLQVLIRSSEILKGNFIMRTGFVSMRFTISFFWNKRVKPGSGDDSQEYPFLHQKFTLSYHGSVSLCQFYWSVSSSWTFT